MRTDWMLAFAYCMAVFALRHIAHAYVDCTEALEPVFHVLPTATELTWMCCVQFGNQVVVQATEYHFHTGEEGKSYEAVYE